MIAKTLPRDRYLIRYFKSVTYGMKAGITLLAFLFFMITGPSPGIAQVQQPDTTVKDLTELSLDDLINVKVITASGTEQTIAEAPATMTVITAQQIEERGYEQLEDALRDVLGIDLIHINGYAPTLIYFRGMYGAENLRALLMIDDIVENNIIGSNDMAGPAYNLHNVLRIEIIWGPASSLYGADAFGGVINIITKKGSEINGIKYQKGFGSFNSSLETVMMGTKKSNFEIAVSGSMYSTDGPRFTNIDPNYDGSYVDKAWSFNGSIAYEAGKSKTTLAARAYETPMGWGTILPNTTVYFGLPSQGNYNLGVVGIAAHDLRGEKPGLEDPFSRVYYLQEDYAASEKLKLMGRVTYRETGIGENSYVYVGITPTTMYYVPYSSYSNRSQADLTADYTLSRHHRFSAGVQYYQDNVSDGTDGVTIDSKTVYLLDGRDTLYNLNSTFLPRKYNIRDHFGSYLQYVLSTNLLRKTDFTFGGRYDYDSYYGSELTPRFAIVNQPADKLTIKLMYGSAFRPPTSTEIYEAYPGSVLKAEKIKTYEANFIYTLSKTYLVQVNGFRNELTDAIAISNLPTTNPNKNPTSETINGIEAKMDMLFSKHFTGFVNFTYQEGRGSNTILGIVANIADIAKVKGNAGIAVHVKDLFTVSVIGNWIGERLSPRTDPYGDVDGYFLTNLVITTTKLADKHLSASIDIRNLFNVVYVDPGFRDADGKTTSTVLEQPGRTTLLKFTVTF